METTQLIPLLNVVFLLVVFALLYKYPPAEINSGIGYSTPKSMKSQAAWDFAQRYSAKLSVQYMVGLLVIDIALLVFFGDQDLVLPAIGLMLTALLLMVIQTERKLKQREQADTTEKLPLENPSSKASSLGVQLIGLTGSVVMVVVFALLYLFPPSYGRNKGVGYRVASAMKNQETWDFAQAYSSKLGLMFSLGVLVLHICLLLYFRKKPLYVHMGGVILMVFALSIAFWQTERKLKEREEKIGSVKTMFAPNNHANE